MAKLLWMAIFLLGGLLALSVSLWAWLGATGLVIALVVAIGLGLWLKRMAGKILKAMILTPFKMKGSVLRDAEVELHAIKAVEMPAAQRFEYMDDADWEAAQAAHAERRAGLDPSQRFLEIELSIRPKPASGEGFKLWEPGELALAGPDVSSAALETENSDEDSLAELDAIEVWGDGAWQCDEGLKYEGPQRLKLTFQVPAGTGRVRLRYYFELLGEAFDLNVPQPA